MNPSVPREGTTLWVRTVDARGVFNLHEFGTLDFAGYQRLEAPLQRELLGLQYPISVLGIVMTRSGQSPQEPRSTVLLDDLSAVADNGDETVIDDFDGLLRWSAIPTATRERDGVSRVSEGAYRGNGAAQFSFRTGTNTPVRGLYVSDPNIPLPAIASQRFLDATGTRPGAEIELSAGNLALPVSIQGSVKLFPSLAEDDNGFLIVNERHLYFYAGLTNQASLLSPNEVWLRLSSDAALRASAASRRSTTTSASRRRRSSTCSRRSPTCSATRSCARAAAACS